MEEFFMKSHLFLKILFLCGFVTGLFASAGVFVYGRGPRGERTFLLARRAGRCWENLSGRFDPDTDADGRAAAMREALEETAGILKIDRRRLEDFDQVRRHDIFTYDAKGAYLNPSLMTVSRQRMHDEWKHCEEDLRNAKGRVDRKNLEHLCRLRKDAFTHIENDDWHWFTLEQIKEEHRNGALCSKMDDYLFDRKGPTDAFRRLECL